MKKSLTLAVALLAVAPFAVSAQDVPEKAAACAACHGEGGAKPIMDAYPVLAGQYANYLQHALQEYRSGARKNGIMAAQAASLSDADIKTLAKYFEAQKGPLYTPKYTVPGK
ncbi:cytochrome c [Sinimarinibacterium sp. NLF-5-8]|uniref:c-type cytochrome n=1 Tax=Sinimarinibacterium sp. NLF-5-8 TaxID=2698684 RepID=UPI00137C14F6|nr:cytochrome c [Sinimarinibacterium sp. NLF-5-8]QHS10663.1 cytochrome c [Sinimarinibacterium sp. NLF-5-8]